MKTLKSRFDVALALLLVGILQGACSSNPGSKTAAAAIRSTEIEHEECDVADASAEKLDANGDGRPEIISVRDGSREVCRQVDLNFDGVPDAWVFYDAAGKVRRRENDYDRDGRIDEISLFKDGVIIERQRATMLNHKMDTWESFSGGRLAKGERDSNGDKLVDQWWEYSTPGCPIIHADVNSDGRPDPGASVDYCKETGYVPPERQDFKKPDSPSFQQTGSLPTEVESKPAESSTPSTGEKAADPKTSGSGSGSGSGNNGGGRK